MDSVGAILAEKERERFPWGFGVLLAGLLHLAIAGAFFASSLGHPLRLAPPRAVAVRILPAGSLRGEATRPASPEPAKPRIEKPVEEAPPPPSKNAVLLPAKEKAKPTPAPSRATAPRAPDVSLPSSGEGSSEAGSGSAAGTPGGNAGVRGTTFDQPGFDYGYYIQAIQIALSTNWFPGTSIKFTPPKVHFKIQRDGTVADAELVRSSGLPFVDRAALRAVLASSFPPLPADWTGPYVGLTVSFE